MLYEKTKCPTCGAITTNFCLMLEEAAATLPTGIELYDFGGGISVMPAPDPSGRGYLTSHLVAVWKTGTRVVTAVAFEYGKELSLEALKALLAKAAEHNVTQEKEFEIAA